ncbi:hypothetical protein [Borrelia duttonii]|uniref:hypothetical protein n=1 Tax=Borrelia duttonii TaxID=40834 RepID=UPI0004AE233A|nr:hypothetical protein [Borrelia duttonii]
MANLYETYMSDEIQSKKNDKTVLKTVLNFSILNFDDIDYEYVHLHTLKSG